MSSRGSRRQIRPLTIYGFRRSRPKRRLWLLLIALGTLTVLPRLISPVAEQLMGDAKDAPKRAHETPRREPGSAFAASDAETPTPGVVPRPELSRAAVAAIESTVTVSSPTLEPTRGKPARVPQSRRRFAVEPSAQRAEAPAKAEAADPTPERRPGRLVPAPH